MFLFHHLEGFNRANRREDMHIFVSEEDLDSSVTTKILDNKLLLNSDSDDEDDEQERRNFNWNEELWDNASKKLSNRTSSVKYYIAGLRNVPRYPKLSSLTSSQHEQCLKVLSAEYKEVLSNKFILQPGRKDRKLFQELQDTYKAEQQEYITWAKTMWTEQHSARALHPKPNVEVVYEAEFKMKAHTLQSFPKNYVMAAQIPLESKYNDFEFTHLEDLVKVDLTKLPNVDYPSMVIKKFSIFLNNPLVPEPCHKHPCKFILPSEELPSVLPLTEVHRELAQFAADNGARYIISESALRCLVQRHRLWTLPISVCTVTDLDGESLNVVVIDNEFQINKETATNRTYRAFRHLLAQSLVPPDINVESQNQNIIIKKKSEPKKPKNTVDLQTSQLGPMIVSDDDDDDEDGRFTIDIDETALDAYEPPEESAEEANCTMDINTTPVSKSGSLQHINMDKQTYQSPFYSCNCEAPFERPAPRSYSKWRMKNITNNDCYDIIVHSSHKFKDDDGEVLLEPIPEYQLELGVSELSQDTQLGTAVSLMLHKHATYIHVRVDGVSGVVATYAKQHTGETPPQVNSSIYSALEQLQGLREGRYLLQHQHLHGANALLYTASGADSAAMLRLEFTSVPSDMEEAATLNRSPPTISPQLLPYHKFRKILPCAFTTNPKELAKETKKPAKQPPPNTEIQKTQKRKRKRKKRTFDVSKED